MARGIIRKPSFWKIVGAYRSQWKRTLRRMFIPGYGKRGMGWWRNPKKAWYNWWYYRTSISIPRLLGYRPSLGSCIFAMTVASFLNVFSFPVDVVKASTRAHKIKKARKARAERKVSEAKAARTAPKTDLHKTEASVHAKTTSSASQSPRRESAPKKTTTSASTVKKTSASHKSTTTVKVTKPIVEPKSEKKSAYSYADLCPKRESMNSVTFPKSDDPIVIDENAPKSRPKHANDQYIRKRMIIAGSSYCDASALAKLLVGTYFDLVAEPDNPHDKEAIALLHNGEKIGYIAKQDKAAFVTCLRLGRSAYGVITNIITDAYPTKYEYETWFDSEGK